MQLGTKELKIFCIIPAYNEEKNISQVIDSVMPYVDKVVVVDDGSQDLTANRACKAKSEVLHHIINRGQGAALQTGNEYALSQGADIVIHYDGDGQFNPADITKMVEPIAKEKYDIVFGSRFLYGKAELPMMKKAFIMPVARLVNRFFVGKNFLTDPQNGFRAMTAKTAAAIRIKNDGSAHCSEIIHKAFKLKLKIKEVPVKINYQNYGQGLFSGRGRGMGGIRTLIDLFISKFEN